MPLYYADTETLNLVKYALSVFKFKDYLSGFDDLSAYLVALTFERIVIKTARKKFPQLEELSLTGVLDFFRKKRLIDEETNRRLRFCRDFRDKVMHQGSKSVSVRETEDVLRELCGMVEIDFAKEYERREFEDILAFSERKVKPRQPIEIHDSDFNEFIVLYEKCLSLQYALVSILAPLQLVPEEISEFVPTSGGIWLPWVVGKAGKRSHMKRMSLGVALTPYNIRIGIDFGSKAYRPKEQYYTLLIERGLDNSLRRLNDNYLVYNTYWYYHIGDKMKLHQYLELSSSSIIKKRIEDSLIEVQTKNEEGAPMTGHKFLIGKILDRGTPEFEQSLRNLRAEINETFSDLRPILESVEKRAW